MPVFIINNMTIHDRTEYDTYVGKFMAVFKQFDGQILAVQDHPPAVEGSWPYDRTILLSFPDREQARRWSESPQYQEIVRHRNAGTTSNIVILDAIPDRPSVGVN